MTMKIEGADIARAPRTRVHLDSGWSFRRAGDADWLPAQIPGSNVTDLLRNGAIDDPFARDNELRLQWIEREDWEYRCVFTLSEADLAADAIALVFEGLDTHCDVRLNGAPLLVADNMFRSWRCGCADLLRPGENLLTLHFRSPVLHGEARYRETGFRYPAENDKTPDHVSVYSRKAPYHFGWDWGPKQVPSGVWRPVWLDIVRTARIAEIAHDITRLDDARAEIAFALEIEGHCEGAAWIDLSCVGPGIAPMRIPVTLVPGTQTCRFTLAIDAPKRWWPNGLGEAFLYRFAISLADERGYIDHVTRAIGLRTIEVVNRPDDAGESFFVKVNGRPVFMKGANYIPPDSFQERVSPERYRRIFRDTADAHMNMLRVWGGGVYECDLFYDLADEHGILIWQDFMFACTLYPSDDGFFASVTEEAEDAVRRLRHHACIALWCGNNEISLGIAHWGWPEKFGYSDARYAQLVEGNRRLFEELLPGIIAAHDPARFYLPSSPIGFWNDPADDSRGDGHYWGVWHGELPFSTYDTRLSRFMSEYGFQSYPLAESIARFTAPEDRAVGSAVLGVHQKHPRGDAIITRFIHEHYGVPASFADFCYLSQMLQADGLRVAFEAHRRNMPFCMGSLYWQLNDCWPAISWSSIDHYGRWKALHHQAARAFAPVILSVEAQDGDHRIFGISDRADDLAATLSITVMDFDGVELWRRDRAVTLPANASTAIDMIAAAELPARLDRAATLIALRLHVGGTTHATAVRTLDAITAADLPDPELVAEALDEHSVRVKAVRYARGVYLVADVIDGSGEPLNFSDNFFDLLPGETRIVTARDAQRFDPATLSVRSIRGATVAAAMVRAAE